MTMANIPRGRQSLEEARQLLQGDKEAGTRCGESRRERNPYFKENWGRHVPLGISEKKGPEWLKLRPHGESHRCLPSVPSPAHMIVSHAVAPPSQGRK